MRCRRLPGTTACPEDPPAALTDMSGPIPGYFCSARLEFQRAAGHGLLTLASCVFLRSLRLCIFFWPSWPAFPPPRSLERKRRFSRKDAGTQSRKENLPGSSLRLCVSARVASWLRPQAALRGWRPARRNKANSRRGMRSKANFRPIRFERTSLKIANAKLWRSWRSSRFSRDFGLFAGGKIANFWNLAIFSGGCEVQENRRGRKYGSSGLSVLVGCSLPPRGRCPRTGTPNAMNRVWEPDPAFAALRQ